MKLLRLKNERMRCVIVNGARRGRSAGVPPDPLAVKGGCHFGYFSHASLQQYSERLDLTYSQTRQRKMVLSEM